MRQLLLIGVFSIVGLIIAGCVSAPVRHFDDIKVNMTKDEVLEIVGNPTRTELYGGKEKWAYRFYTDEEKDQWDLRQVTFVEGKVVSVGEDTDEENRLKQINVDDAGRAERLKNFKLGPAPDAQPASAGTVNGGNSEASDPVPDQVVPKESDFIEMKGRHAPANNGDDSSK